MRISLHGVRHKPSALYLGVKLNTARPLALLPVLPSFQLHVAHPLSIHRSKSTRKKSTLLAAATPSAAAAPPPASPKPAAHPQLPNFRVTRSTAHLFNLLSDTVNADFDRLDQLEDDIEGFEMEFTPPPSPELRPDHAMASPPCSLSPLFNLTSLNR